MQSIYQFFFPPPIDTPRIKIRGIGINERMPATFVDRAKGTGDYLLMLFEDAVVINDDTTWPAGTLILWDPSQAHHYGNVEHEWQHSWMHFDGQGVVSALNAVAFSLNKPITLTNPSVVNHYLWEIYREVTEHSAPSETIVLNAISSLLTDIERQCAGEVPAPPPELLALRHYLGENVHEAISLAEMAQRVDMSPSHFSAQFKRWFGISPIDYHIHCRLHTATHLLRDGNRSVAEVARVVGYEDPFHFSKQFKARFGVSPRDIR